MMNARMLIVLTLSTAVALALSIVLVNRSDSDPEGAVERLLLPELKGRVNDIAALDIIGADGETVAQLRRDRERWRLREMHDHEASFRLIHDLLRGLVEAQRLEARTDNPEWHARLGLADPGSGEGSGVAVRFPEAAFDGVIIGKSDPAGIGRYARIEGESRSWLTDLDPELPTDAIGWLESAIMDIPAADIAAVSIRHPDGQTVELRPADEAGETWVLLDAPAEREVKPAWQLRQAASALAALGMEDVRPHERVPDDAVEVRYRTRDGLDFNASMFAEDDAHWVRFTVAPAPREANEEGERSARDEGEAGADEDDESAIDAVAVDGRLSPWQYAISKSRFERMTHRLEDLLEPVEED